MYYKSKFEIENDVEFKLKRLSLQFITPKLLPQHCILSAKFMVQIDMSLNKTNDNAIIIEILVYL